MARSRRVKRANVVDLYRTCKAAGTCPPDVIPKVEQNTIADQILKYGSMGVYFGGLGIGTGSSRPGLGTYTPVRPPGGGGTRVLSGLRPSGGGRPFPGGLPLDTIGAGVRGGGRVNVPTDTVETVETVLESTIPRGDIPAEAPSVILPEEMPPDPGLGGLDISVDTGEQIPLIVVGNGESTSDVAVIDVTPGEHPRRTRVSRISYSTSTHHNPSFQGHSTSGVGETSASENIFIGGSNVGSSHSEDIELQVFNEPRSSTPGPSLGRPLRGRNNWFSRMYYRQVGIDNAELLRAPERVFAAEFDNPVFDASFDIGERLFPDIAPAPEFEDVTHIGAARVFRGPSGRVGLSRVGYRPSITTRSGVSIGEHIHYRASFSTIDNAEESFELSTFNTSGQGGHPQHSSETILTDGHDAFEEVDMQSVGSVYSDQYLLDDYSQDTPHGTLVLMDEDQTNVIPIQDISLFNRPVTSFPLDEPVQPITPVEGPVIIEDDIIPGLVIVAADIDGTYYIQTVLDPSLLRKKRKRKSEVFVEYTNPPPILKRPRPL